MLENLCILEELKENWEEERRGGGERMKIVKGNQFYYKLGAPERDDAEEETDRKRKGERERKRKWERE